MDDPWCQAVPPAVCGTCYRTVVVPIILPAAIANSVLQTTDERSSFHEQYNVQNALLSFAAGAKLEIL